MFRCCQSSSAITLATCSTSSSTASNSRIACLTSLTWSSIFMRSIIHSEVFSSKCSGMWNCTGLSALTSCWRSSGYLILR